MVGSGDSFRLAYTPPELISLQDYNLEVTIIISSFILRNSPRMSTSVPIWLDNPECSSASSGNSNLRGCFNPHGTGRVSQYCDYHDDVVLSCVGGIHCYVHGL